jgi:hypothetical protein
MALRQDAPAKTCRSPAHSAERRARCVDGGFEGGPRRAAPWPAAVWGMGQPREASTGSAQGVDQSRPGGLEQEPEQQPARPPVGRPSTGVQSAVPGSRRGGRGRRAARAVIHARATRPARMCRPCSAVIKAEEGDRPRRGPARVPLARALCHANAWPPRNPRPAAEAKPRAAVACSSRPRRAAAWAPCKARLAPASRNVVSQSSRGSSGTSAVPGTRMA